MDEARKEGRGEGREGKKERTYLRCHHDKAKDIDEAGQAGDGP